MKTKICHGWSILLLILLFRGNTFAQQSEGDKLRKQIATESNDTCKIKLLIKFGLEYTIRDSEQLWYLKKAFDLSKKNNYRYGLLFGQYYDGLLLSHAGNYNEALGKYKSCIDGLDSLGTVQSINSPLSEIRTLFNLAGQQGEKFRYYSDKLIFYKRHGPVVNAATCFHSVAGFYLYFGDYDKAIEYYIRAQNIYQSYDPYASAFEKQRIGGSYLYWGNLPKATEYVKSALKDWISYDQLLNCDIFDQYGDICFAKQDYGNAMHYYFEAKKHYTKPLMQVSNLLNIFKVHLQMKSYDSAWIYLSLAEKIFRQEELNINYVNNFVPIELSFYSYYVAIGNGKLAIQQLEGALQKSRKARNIPYILRVINELQTYLLKKGDSIQALRYIVQYNALEDSVKKINTEARVASFEIEQQQQAKENEIEHLQVQKKEQRNYYLFGGAFLLLIVMAVIILILYRRKRDKAQLTSDFKNQLARAETKALRAQMNPHFIFNSLNSINNFVTDQKHEITSDYLLRFSKLIRLILDNSRSETIPLDKELETLQLYVQLESIRFENHFKYVVNIAENTSTGSIMIPPMLLQPFIENAIWHGLMQKRTKGTIAVDISKENENFLHISITDDGIGREKAAEMKSKSATHQSHGLKVTSERIDMMNKLHSTGAQVHIIDLKDEQGNALGTRVELIIPI